ncbi:MAG: hypothetical protein ACRY3E_04025 [Candidatus Lariskella arthropodorum]
MKKRKISSVLFAVSLTALLLSISACKGRGIVEESPLEIPPILQDQ